MLQQYYAHFLMYVDFGLSSFHALPVDSGKEPGWIQTVV